MNKLCYKSKFVNSWGKINSKWKAIAKNNQKNIIWDILQGAKKRIHAATFYSKSGGPFFKSHPVDVMNEEFETTTISDSTISDFHFNEEEQADSGERNKITVVLDFSKF